MSKHGLWNAENEWERDGERWIAMKQKWQPAYKIMLYWQRTGISNKQYTTQAIYQIDKYLYLVANHSALNCNKNERDESEFKWIWTIVLDTMDILLHSTLLCKCFEHCTLHTSHWIAWVKLLLASLHTLHVYLYVSCTA